MKRDKVKGYSSKFRTWEEEEPMLISGRGKEENKEVLGTYYTLDTLSYILYVYTFIDSFNTCL